MAPDSGATQPGRFSNSLSQIAAPAGGSASDLISVLPTLWISVGGCRASICLEGVYLWMKSRSISVIQTTMRHAKDLSDDNSTVHTSCFHTCSVCRHEYTAIHAHTGYSCSAGVSRLGPACSQSDSGVECHCIVNLGSHARYLIRDSIIWFRNCLCRLRLCVRIMSIPGRPCVWTEAFDLCATDSRGVLYSVDHGVHALVTTYLVLPDSRWVIVYPHVQHVVLDQE